MAAQTIAAGANYLRQKRLPGGKLHPNRMDYQAMGMAIDLALFGVRAGTPRPRWNFSFNRDDRDQDESGFR